MNFTINKIDLIELMRVCGLMVSKDDIRPMLTYISCEISGDDLTATALDGYAMVSTSYKILTVAVSETPIKFTLPVFKVLRDSCETITIDVSAEETCIDFGPQKHIYKNFKGEFTVDPKKIWPSTEKVLSISVKPKLLMKALKCHEKSDYVDIDFYGDKLAFTMESEGIKSLTLPMKFKRRKQ